MRCCASDQGGGVDLLYADNHLLVVNKPAGIASSAQQEPSVELWAREFVKKMYQKKGEAFVYVVHRLDKPVSGVLLLAKTSKALERLQKASREKAMQKTYLAWVEGSVESPGLWEDFVVHASYHAEIALPSSPQAQKASLFCRICEKKNHRTLLEITLHTGRYHQIRIQCASRGHPIVYDGKYGSSESAGGPWIALHHRELVFEHPVTKERLRVQAPLPSYWES